MAKRTSFFNGVPYDADTVNQRFSYMFSDGIIVGESGIGDAFKVSVKTGMTLTVANGIFHIKGAILEIYEDGEDITLPAADAGLPRYDTIVVEYNLNTDVNDARISVVSGTPSSYPSVPTLSKTALLYQYPLANIWVPPSTLTIETIYDVRGSDICRVLAQTYKYDSTLPTTGNEGDVFFLLAEE